MTIGHNAVVAVIIIFIIMHAVTSRAKATKPAIAEERNTPSHHAGAAGVDAGVITVKVPRRSQWDPHAHSYQAARVVATAATRLCDDPKQCSADSPRHDAWVTAVVRTPPFVNVIDASHRRHRGGLAHPWQIFRTLDNRTYTEVDLDTTGQASDAWFERDLLDKVKLVADLEVPRGGSGKMVLWLDVGGLWPVPRRVWSSGEMALHSGVGVMLKYLADPVDDDLPGIPT